MATSKPGGFERYATSTKNITGCVLAVGGPILAAVGVVAPPVGLALVPALYAIGALVAPHRKRVNLVAGVTPGDVQKSLADIQREISGRVPPEIGEKVAHISQTITDCLPRADALGAGSPGQYVLVQCATNYLPSTLQGYLSLPRSYADHHVVDKGQTARDMLSDQLDVLSKQIDEIAEAVNAADTDQLAANGRFLAERFGASPLDIEEPAAGAAPSAPPSSAPRPSAPSPQSLPPVNIPPPPTIPPPPPTDPPPKS